MPRREWEPSDINSVMVSGTVCICLLLLVVGTVVGVLKGIIKMDIGTVSGIGAGGGLLGLLRILYVFIKPTLPRNTNSPTGDTVSRK